MLKNKECKGELRLLVLQQPGLEKFILGSKDAIIVVENTSNRGFTMIHERLIDGQLHEINRWTLNNYRFGVLGGVAIKSDYNLFMVQNGNGVFDGVYNYKDARFVVPQNVWDSVDPGYGDRMLRRYGCFVGSFDVSSDLEDDDSYSYTNPITGEKSVETFVVRDKTYFGIIDPDGSIRDGKLFKGSSLSKITEIIDLKNYESVKIFKDIKKQMCNIKKYEAKLQYRQLIESRNNGSMSPYYGLEVEKVLNLKK